ncbi:uracil-DNA glycosylase family protein [Salinirubellus sp. GCM10025818]|uniref:uracil-DNA glycosylase n=1 Tax=Salinirubellus TaxID=2162630 RepID=UPI003610DC2B
MPADGTPVTAPTEVPYPDPDERNDYGGCRRCPALVDCRERISWGVGPRDAAVVVVGEAPGAGDPDAERWKGGNWTGMAYTSRASGRKVRAMVADLGYADEAYYTNAVKCFPCEGRAAHGDDETPTNREPTTEELANCRPYLLDEITTVSPDWVLATGKHATSSLFAAADRAVDGFLDRVLEPVVVEGIEPPVLPLLHPSYQEVWLTRLGHSRESYLEEIRSVLGGRD